MYQELFMVAAMNVYSVQRESKKLGLKMKGKLHFLMIKQQTKPLRINSIFTYVYALLWEREKKTRKGTER